MWIKTKLDEVCTVKGRIGYRGYTKQDLVKEGDGAISLSPSNIIDNKLIFKKTTYISWKKYEESPEIMVYPGDIIFCKTASIGKMALIDSLPEKATLNPQFVVLKNIKCLNKFLFYSMISTNFQKQIKDIIGGTAIPTLSQKNLGENFIFLPPKKEQQRIVAKLDAAFAEIDKKNQINLKKLNYVNDLKNSILNNQLGDNLIKLSDACDLIKRGISPKYLETGGIAVINQKCIRNHKIDYSKARRHDMNLKKVPEERLIRKGDVLINSTGHGTLGRVAQVNQEPFEKTTVDSHVTIIRPKKELFNLSFFGNALIKIEKQLEAAGEGTSGQTELSRSKLENEFFIPYLDSTYKQKKISILLNTMFESTFALKNLTSKIIENMKALRLSFLHKELYNKTS